MTDFALPMHAATVGGNLLLRYADLGNGAYAENVRVADGAFAQADRYVALQGLPAVRYVSLGGLQKFFQREVLAVLPTTQAAVHQQTLFRRKMKTV